MDELDILAPHFRRSVERWPDAPTLSVHYDAVTESYGGTTHGLITTVKSFVECVCLTVLGDFGRQTPSTTPSTTELLVEALRCLNLQNNEGGSKVNKLLSAHNKLADALSELRNDSDPIAHGRDGFIDLLSDNEKRAFVLTADTILALLLAAHDRTEPDLQYTRSSYERFTLLHERIDQAVGVDVAVSDEDERQTVLVTIRTDSLPEGIQLRIEPSRLLYAVDRSAYVEILGSATTTTSVGVEDEEPDEQAVTPSLGTIQAKTVPAVPVNVVAYDGRLANLRPQLSVLLDALGIHIAEESPSAAHLVDSLLATAEQHMGLDWATREPLIAAMRVALRRVLVQVEVDRDRADQIAAETVEWLRTHASQVEGP